MSRTVDCDEIGDGLDPGEGSGPKCSGIVEPALEALTTDVPGA